MTSTTGSPLLRRAPWRPVAALAALVLVGSTAALAAPGAVPPASAAVPAAGTWGGYVINGTVPDGAPGQVQYDDPAGAGKELGPVGGLKVAELHGPRPETLTPVATSDKSDLKTVWLDISQDAAGVPWLYLAWERISNNGSVVVVYEFQKGGGAPTGCVWTAPATSCNPWRQRVAGDFVIVFDYQGLGVSKVWKRDFVQDGAGLKLDTGFLLNTPVPLPGQPVGQAATSADELRGEAAINLLAGNVFPTTPTSCSSFATLVPYSVTGNSDQAAPEDVVLADTSKAALGNCGKVSITKQTTPQGGVDQPFTATLSRTTPGAKVGYPDATRSATVNAASPSATVVTDLRPGSDYTLTETALPGWEPVSVVCGGVPVITNGVATGQTFSVSVDATTACTVVNKQLLPAVRVVKEASPSSGLVLGGTVTWTADVTSTGNVPLSSVSVADLQCSGGAMTYRSGDDGDAVLEAGETWRHDCTTTVTQADMDAGARDNTATAYGQYGSLPRVEHSEGARFTTVVAPGITVDKTVVGSSTGRTVGQVVTFQVTARNSGSQTLADVQPSDPLCTLARVSGDPDTGTAGSLDVGETWTYRCAYTVTQDDVDAGGAENRAVVSAQPPAGLRVEDDGRASFSTSTTASFSSVKRALDPTVTPRVPAADRVLGDPVLYVVEVTNTGVLTLTGTSVVDPGCTPMALEAASDAGGDGKVSPGETWTYTCAATTTQADVDRGFRDNTATVTVRRLDGTALPQQQPTARFTTAQRPDLTLTKTPSVPTAGVGQDVVYTVTATNSGNVTLTGLGVGDPLCTLVAVDPAADDVLAPGESKAYRCAVRITQAMVDTGELLNTATANASAGATPLTRTADARVDLPRTSSLDVEKTGPTGPLALGANVPWEVTVRNAGGATLSALSVTDSLCALTQTGVDTTGATVLAVGETQTYTCTTTVGPADLLAGSVMNTAGAMATGPDRGVSDSDTATVLTVPDVQIQVDKQATPSSGVVAGDVVRYDVTAQNDGNVPLSGVTASDPRCTLTGPTGDDGDGQLEATETWTWTCAYTVLQTDIDAGATFSNTATGSGSFGVVTDTDTGTAVVTPRRQAAIALDKQAPTGALALGSSAVYTLVVTNPGTVSLSAVGVTDPLCATTRTGGDADGDGRLQPTETWTYSCTHVVTQDDVDRGRIDNTATATGTGHAGAVTADDSASVVLPRDPRLEVVKTAQPAAGVRAGDTVTYAVTVRNSGTTTLRDVVVQDPLCTLVRSTGDDALQVGEVWTYGCTYVVTQADVDRGRVDNTATATATGGGRTVTGTASAVVTAPQSPAVTVDKTADPAAGVAAGAAVVYTVTVRNTGNVPLGSVVLTDPLCTLSVTAGDLDADQVLDLGETWTATCRYTVTQEDVDRGRVENTATGRGTFGGTTVSDTGSAVVQVPQGPALAVTKAASPLVFSNVGDVIRYTYVVTNSGTTTLSGPFRVEDDKTPVSCPTTTSLARGASLTCTADYAVTAADLAAGFVVNVARATNGTVVSPDVSARVDEVQVLPAVVPSPSASPSPAAGRPAPARPATLPFTGIPVLAVLALGSGAVLMGALLVGGARARRQDD
jgi:uncharacterized repeat protein (TIGR01451 family)